MISDISVISSNEMENSGHYIVERKEEKYIDKRETLKISAN